MTLSKKQSIDLYFDQYRGTQPLATTQFIGKNMRLAFDENSKMALEIAHETYFDHLGDAHDALVMRGSNRAENDWLALEVDVDPQFEKINLTMRYAPAERVYPRVYIKGAGHDTQVDLPDFTIGFDWCQHQIAGNIFDHFYDKPRNQITHLRLALLFPNRPWFALGVSQVTQEVR